MFSNVREQIDTVFKRDPVQRGSGAYRPAAFAHHDCLVIVDAG